MMNDDKKIGFSVELENGCVDLWAHGDDETLVNLAVAAMTKRNPGNCCRMRRSGWIQHWNRRWSIPPRKLARKC